MEADPFPAAMFLFSNIVVKSFYFGQVYEIITLILLLILSGLVSASEVAYFSLLPNEIDKIKRRKTLSSHKIISLLLIPERLLATILVTNTFVNIGIVMVSTNFTSGMFDFSESPVLGFVFQAVIITSLILLFGEIFPKSYATHFKLKMANLMAIPLTFLSSAFYPITYFLIKSSTLIKKKVQKKSNVTINDLSHAIDLVSEELQDEEQILKGIVNFGNTDVKEIIISRMNVVTVDLKHQFTKVIQVIIDSGYSRIPVISGSFDNIKGVLYIKDLLPHIHKLDFRWQSLIRPPYFVPETKKINDLLEEFQIKKNHMAIVIDEYGGTSGIVTLEDILEEIVGDIDDEFDIEDNDVIKLSENEYLFEGKTSLNDFYRAVNINEDIFDNVKGEADTLAGVILEIKGNIPKKNEVISIGNINFRIKSADSRRIKQLIVTLKKD